MSWRPNESRRPWRDNRDNRRRGRGGYGFHRENWDDMPNRYDRPWRGSHRQSVMHAKPHITSRDPSPEDEARAEKIKNASLLKNKLNSLTVKDKSESMKQLLTTTTNETLSDKPKETKDTAIIEKESRRIAHVPKPIKPVPPPPTLPPLLAEHLEADMDIITTTPRERIKRKLLQDLIAMPIIDLKNMVEKPKSKDNLFLTHLMKKTRVSLSDAMRKLAEHKLQIVGSENPLTELENLVDPDLAVDVCRMPVETIQALRDIFDMNLDGDLELMEPPPPPVLHSYDWENMEQSDMDLETESELPVHEGSSGQFSWHTPYNIDINRSFIPIVPSEQLGIRNSPDNSNSLSASINYTTAISSPGINTFNLPSTPETGSSPVPKPVPQPIASFVLPTAAAPTVKPEPSLVLQPEASLTPKSVFPPFPQPVASIAPKPVPPPVLQPAPPPISVNVGSVASVVPQPVPPPLLQRVGSPALKPELSPGPQRVLSAPQPAPARATSVVPQPVPPPLLQRVGSPALKPELSPAPQRVLTAPQPALASAPQPVPPPEPLQIIIEKNKHIIDMKRQAEKQNDGITNNAEINLQQGIKLEKGCEQSAWPVSSSTYTHDNKFNTELFNNLPTKRLENAKQHLSKSNSEPPPKMGQSEDNSNSGESSKKLSLHEKLLNMAQLNQLKEIKKRFASQSTQTRSKRLKNSSTQCHTHKLISKECQATPIPVAKSTQSVQTQFQRFNAASQTIERLPFQDAVVQTDFKTSNSEQSSQTEMPTKTFVDNFTQHTVLFSNRGEQVNLTFFTANKYSQTKAPEPLKQVKNTDSLKKDNVAEVTSALPKETMLTFEPSASAENIEKSSVFKEFSTLQNDIKALGTGSFLRRRLVSSMLDLMSSTFTNFSNLFSDILERSNRQELKVSKATSNKKQIYNEKRKRAHSLSSSSDGERNSVKHSTGKHRDKKIFKRTIKDKEKSSGRSNHHIPRKESTVTKDSIEPEQGAKKRRLIDESDEDGSLDSAVHSKHSSGTSELTNYSSKKKVKGEEETNSKNIKKEFRVKLIQARPKISNEPSKKLTVLKEKLTVTKPDDANSNKTAKKEMKANLLQNESKQLNETLENADPQQETANLTSRSPEEKTVTKVLRKLSESNSTATERIVRVDKSVKKVFEKDTKARKMRIIDSSDEEEEINRSSKTTLEKNKKSEDSDTDDDEFEVSSKTGLKKVQIVKVKGSNNNDNDEVEVSSKTSLIKEQIVKVKNSNYSDKVEGGVSHKTENELLDGNDIGSVSVQKTPSPPVQRSNDWYKKNYKLRDCFVNCSKLIALPGTLLQSKRRNSRIGLKSSTIDHEETSLRSGQQHESQPSHSASSDLDVPKEEDSRSNQIKLDLDVPKEEDSRLNQIKLDLDVPQEEDNSSNQIQIKLDMDVPQEEDSSSNQIQIKSEPTQSPKDDGKNLILDEHKEVSVNMKSRSPSPQLKPSSASPPGCDGHPVDPNAEPNKIEPEDTGEETVDEPNNSPLLLDEKSITTASELSAHDLGDDCIDVKRKHLVSQIEFVGHTEAITDFKISSNHLLAASGKAVVCFSIKSGKRKRMYTGHKTCITSLCLLAKRDGEVVYSGSYDNIIRAFSVQTSSLLRSTSGLDGTPLSLVSLGSWSSNGILYGFLSNGDIISINPKTLKIENKDETGDLSFLCGIAAEVNSRRTFFISTSKCQVFIKEEKSGAAGVQQLDWECEVPAQQLVYHNGSLYCGSQLTQIVAFNISAQPVIRSVINCSCDTVGLSIFEYYLLVGSRMGEFTVFDVSTQTVKDTFTKEGKFNLLTIHKKMIIGSCENGKLIAWPLPQRVRKILHR